MRMLARITASQMASASAASFLLVLTKGLTYSAGISRTSIGPRAGEIAETILSENTRHVGAGRCRACLPRSFAAADRRSRRLGSGITAPNGFAFRLPRHTLRGRQDEAAVAASRQQLSDLKSRAAAGAFDLLFLDKSEALT
jgi:hypothetical protein